MSTQQIPSAAQIAAARSALWHQNTPAPVAPVPDADISTASSSAPAEATAPPSSDLLTDLPSTGTPPLPGEVETEPQAESPTEPQGSSQTEPQTEEPSGSQSATEDPLPETSASSDPQPSPVDHAATDHPGIDLSDPDDSQTEPQTEPTPTPKSRQAAVAPSVSVALITQSSARDFLNRAGLLLFSAKPQFANVPAPTFVEATLGVANANPSFTASATARTLLARLVADGSAVPLNLLGLPSTTAESPDFIVSAAAFPFIFTLRGDKAWKQPPSTSGASKVSPLAANTYTLLIENGPKSAYDLVADLGKEVTEAAVLRALSELWQQLRVVPVSQPGGKPTIWEPITTRFTKQIKTGANAGQPTALSTFISLYLGQSILATEDEIETFLSPLAPRSRVRDVLHALTGARELETITVEGRHHVHIAGDLPVFENSRAAEQPDELPVLAEDGSRIKKFVPKPRKLGTGSGDRPKPFRAPSDRARPDSRPGRKSSGDRAASSARPTFNKPWEEEKQARTDRAAASQTENTPEYQDIDLDAGAERPQPSSARPSFARKPSFGNKPSFGRKPGFAAKPGFNDRPRGGDRPAFNRDRPSGDRPAFSRDRPPSDRPGFDRAPREGGSDRFQPRDARRDFTPHTASGSDSRPPRHFGNKPGFGGKPSFGAKPSSPRKPFDPERSAGDRERRPFRRDDAAAGDSRPSRRTFDSGARPTGPRPGGSARPFAGKPGFSRDRDATGGSSRPAFRKFDAPRPPRDGEDSRPPRRNFDSGRTSGNDRPAPRGGDFSGPKSFGAKPFPRREGSAPRREGFAPREGGSSFPRREGSFPPRREGGFAGKREGSSGSSREGGFAGKKPFAPRSASGAGAGKPFKKPLSRSAPDAPGASTFDKFKNNAKPWGKRPPARKFKPKEDEA